MVITAGELVKLEAKAATTAIQQMAWDSKLRIAGEVFGWPSRSEHYPNTSVLEYSLEKANQKLASFSAEGAPAREMTPPTEVVKTARFGHVYMKQTLSTQVLKYIRTAQEDMSADNKVERASGHILKAIKHLKSRDAHLVEWACAQALTGVVSISETTDPQNIVVMEWNYGFQSTHQQANASADWSAAATKILSHASESWADITGLLVDDCGIEAGEVWMNRVTNKYLVANTEVASYYSDQKKDALMSSNMVRHLDGCDVETYNRKYVNAAGTAVNFIADDHILVLPPKELRDTFRIWEGDVLYPDKSASQGLGKSKGVTVWFEVLNDPTRLVVYLEHNFMPVIHDPDAIVKRDVTP